MTATGFVDIVELAARIMASTIGHPRALIGIGGPGKSGKSTLARQLAATMANACLVHVDDFYLPSSQRDPRRNPRRNPRHHQRPGSLTPWFDLPRLAQQVLTPAAAGKALRYQRYDWDRYTLAVWIDIPDCTPTIVEGVCSLAAELRSAYTFTVWCTARPALRLHRGLERDGEHARHLWLDLWMPAEEAHATSQQPERFAHLVVDSSDATPGEPVFRMVRHLKPASPGSTRPTPWAHPSSCTHRGFRTQKAASHVGPPLLVYP